VFWWRKRNEGFEWRDYVRTTILVRREQRRQRVKDIQAAAAAHVAGARSAGSGTAHYARKLATALAAFAGRAATATVSALTAGASGVAAAVSAVTAHIGGPLGPILEPVLSRAREPRPNLALKIAAVLTALGALYRSWSFGFDTDAMIAAVIAGLATVVLALAYLTDPYRARRAGSRDGLLARLRDTELTLPGDRRVSGTVAAGAVLATLALIALGGTFLYSGAPGRIAGLVSAVAVSGDSLRVAGTFVTLDGIEAPEASQYCERKTGKWRCGAAAKDALADLVRGKRIACDIVGEENGLKQARCYSRGIDLAQELVRKGSVFSSGGFLSRYASYESEAQAEKLGLWAGDAERPQDFRDKRWAEATKSAPDGCPIKGRIRAGARTYVLPWSASYDSTKPSKAKGERWFCSETEAKAAGWSRAS
jgi:endonuclease YncB( thermonuclease family)